VAASRIKTQKNIRLSSKGLGSSKNVAQAGNFSLSFRNRLFWQSTQLLNTVVFEKTSMENSLRLPQEFYLLWGCEIKDNRDLTSTISIVSKLLWVKGQQTIVLEDKT
jgi:hypothetical protein